MIRVLKRKFASELLISSTNHKPIACVYMQGTDFIMMIATDTQDASAVVRKLGAILDMTAASIGASLHTIKGGEHGKVDKARTA